MTQSRSTMTRRTFLGVAGSAAGAALMSACGKSSTQAGGKVDSISFADWTNSNDAVATAVQEFQKTSSLKVQVQAPVAFDQYATRFRTLLASSTPPDIVRHDDDFVAQYSKEGALADLRPYIKAKNFDESSVIPAYKFPIQSDGRHTAWVVGVQPRVMVYNKTMFQKENVPLPPTTWTDTNWKWDDFLQTAKKLTIPGQRWGALLLNDLGYMQTWSINNNGVGIFSKDGKQFTLANSKGIEAMQFIADMTNKYHVQPTLADIKADNAAQTLFAQQKLGMFLATFGVVPYLQQNIKDFEWDVAPIPGQVNQLEEGSLVIYAVPSHSKKQEAAFELLDFLASKTAGDIYASKNAFIPVNASSGSLIKPKPGVAPANIQLFLDAALNHNTNINFTPYSATVEAIYQPLMDRIWNGEDTAQNVLTGVKPQIESILAGKS